MAHRTPRSLLNLVIALFQPRAGRPWGVFRQSFGLFDRGRLGLLGRPYQQPVQLSDSTGHTTAGAAAMN
jgi:hypothetical protein